jgi:hypothetical protein
MPGTQLASNRSVFQGRQIALLPILLLLDGFMLGGCVVLFMVRNLLLEKCCSTEPMVGAVYNLLDYLIPYYLFFGGALIVCAGLTVLVWKAFRPTA